MAEQAAVTLGGLDLATLSEAVVTKVFRDLAKTLHPDCGGDAKKFVEADRAKCILIRWLQRPQVAPPSLDDLIPSERCPMCGGTGRRTLQRGFHTMTMVCGTCRGLGELVRPDKVEE